MSVANSIRDALRAGEPSRLACRDTQRSITYGALVELVDREVSWLDRRRVEHCALLADNGVGWMLTDLALFLRGTLNVPVPEYFTTPQLRHALDDVGVEWILTDRPERIAGLDAGWSHIGQSEATDLHLLRRRSPAALNALPANTHKITYTSGSTAEPKGVCLSNAAIERVACSLADATASLNVRRHLSLLPLATLLENIAGIYVPLLLGATTILPACAHSGMSYGAVDLSRLLATISAAEPDSLVLVPELLRMLLHAASRGWRPPPTLKFVAVGGASVSIELLEQADRLGIPVFEGYGLSECASVVCLNTPASRRKGSVGKQLPHAGVRLDERGEICIRGAVMSGYVGGPAVRDEVRSGDLGEMDEDGFLYVRGRLKNLFITSMGRNVAPEWVEREITCEDSIAHAFVAGEARPYAVALLQPSSPQLDATHLDAAVAAANARLPDYARVRRWACFPEAPSHASGLLTANGRLRRAAIQQRHAALIESLYQPA